MILPSIDNIKQDTFEVQRYENSAHGYSWELWCMYISPPKDWWDAGDPSLPIRWVAIEKCSKHRKAAVPSKAASLEIIFLANMYFLEFVIC